MNKFINITFILLLLVGCTGPRVLGSKRYLPNDSETIRDLSISNLHIRQTKVADKECSIGSRTILELDGPINSDSAFVISKVLSEIPKCINESGVVIVPTIYLNSDGGNLFDGYEIGRIFRKYKVSARVDDGQVCASACAVAFLGARFRTVSNDAKLVFHAPYIRTSFGIECKNANSVEHLSNFYNEMLGSAEDSERLFKRTMSYCGVSTGWVLDSGAAAFFGISTK